MKAFLLPLTLFLLLSISCAKKEDVCDKAVRIACEDANSFGCNNAKKNAEFARQNDSISLKQEGLESCEQIVNMYEALIELKKEKEVRKRIEGN
jgi:23S rRNA G2445 N2-methylase RlmL